MRWVIDNRELTLTWELFAYALHESDGKKYRSDFRDFPELYEYLDREWFRLRELGSEKWTAKLYQGHLHSTEDYAWLKDGDFGPVRRFYLHGQEYDCKKKTMWSGPRSQEMSALMVFRDLPEVRKEIRAQKLRRILAWVIKSIL